MRSLLLSLFLSTALLAAAGCGAHRSYTIYTDETGSLRGLRTSPEDGDHDVPTDVWIRVYWLADYTPPTEFAFALRDGSDTGFIRRSTMAMSHMSGGLDP